jgi:glucose/arabinose dehydrogenase
MKKTVCLLFGLAAAIYAASPANAADAKATLIGHFSNPLYVTSAPGEPNLLFVVEQTGKIRVVENDVVKNRPFLDLSTIITCCDERGVLSIAFPPDYQSTRLFYVAFTNTDGDVEVSEFKRNVNPRVASMASRRTVITIPHRDAGNHNGGQLQFGPDGFLYLSVGDGGATPESAPNLHLLTGKILRINPRPGAGKAYRIPPDNPYVGTGKRHEIWSYGLRNPWRFSFEGNRIIIADVGQNSFEEINYLKLADSKGANFGWPQFEGKQNTGDGPAGIDPPTFPMLVYSHAHGCAVIGGYVSHDPSIPALEGRYLYGDLCSGVIRSMVPHVIKQTASGVRDVGITAGNLSSFGRGPDGRLYFTQTSGELSRIDPP